MYGIRRDTIEYFRGVEKFMDRAIEDMSRRGNQTIICPCRDCHNLRSFQNVEKIRVHLIRHGFKERYTQWVWHGENFKVSINVRMSESVLNSESDGEI
jgi:DUF438 domain-containing protein